MAQQKLGLIDDWKRAWKFASVRINFVGLLLMAIDFAAQTFNSLPPQIQQLIPNANRVALVLFALGIVGRIFKLKDKPDASDNQN